MIPGCKPEIAFPLCVLCASARDKGFFLSPALLETAENTEKKPFPLNVRIWAFISAASAGSSRDNGFPAQFAF
jgi:hypothetical protein